MLGIRRIITIFFLEGAGPSRISPMPRSPPLPGPPWAGAGRTERIQLDSSGAGADGQDAQRGAVAEGTGLVREAVLYRLQREPRWTAHTSPCPPACGVQCRTEKPQHTASPSRREVFSPFKAPTQIPKCAANPRPMWTPPSVTADPVLGHLAIHPWEFILHKPTMATRSPGTLTRLLHHADCG